MEYPFLRKRDRGSGAGRAEIVFSEEYDLGEAQLFAVRIVRLLGLTVSRRSEGPFCSVWEARGAGGEFLVGFDDFPCETTLWAADPRSDPAIEQVFRRLVGGCRERP
jgi:hypothetical protein